MFSYYLFIGAQKKREEIIDNSDGVEKSKKTVLINYFERCCGEKFAEKSFHGRYGN